MLLSLAFIFLLGMFLGKLCQRIQLPELVGMVLTGIILGPCLLNILAPDFIAISPELRQIALAIILIRGGLALDLKALKKSGLAAFLLCFLPASAEILAITLLAPYLLNFSLQEAFLLGTVLAAVSPAVIVPRMVMLHEKQIGTKKGIPQLILAGASVDDIYVIVLFTTALGLLQGFDISIIQFVNIPTSIATGALIGGIAGYLLAKFFATFHLRDTDKVLIILGLSFIFIFAEPSIRELFPFSGLISIMALAIALQRYRLQVAERLSAKFGKLWVAAGMILFVLVGSLTDISALENIGPNALALIFLALAFRSLGVWLCLIKTSLTAKEKLFIVFSYLPKATVQAAIGGIPLAMGLSCGASILSMAVLSILITAPLGAIAIDRSYRKLLK